MLFNLDKESKKNILENYRIEALLSSLRKKVQKRKEIEEDKYNLLQKEKRQKEMMEQINKEKLIKRENIKKEYNLMLQRTKGLPIKKTKLILNNWGQKNENLILPAINSDNFIQNKSRIINNINNNDFRKLSPNQKEKVILKQVDHMNEYLTDKQNCKEMIQYFKIQKENRNQFYKDLLYSQYQEVVNKDFNLYGTNDELIIKQKKKKNLAENPYIYNKNYNFGSSSLRHNPIVNPENDFNYNKYINCQSYRLNPERGRNNYAQLFKINSMENMRYNKYNNNINNKNPVIITRYNLDIINNKYDKKENTLAFKRNLSQGNIDSFNSQIFL